MIKKEQKVMRISLLIADKESLLNTFFSFKKKITSSSSLSVELQHVLGRQ
jgi:hypothetical protein